MSDRAAVQDITAFFPPGYSTNLLPGTYLIEFAPPPTTNYSKPPNLSVDIVAGQPRLIWVNYSLASARPSQVLFPFPVPTNSVGDMTTYPFGFNGQLQSDVGYGSGVAVQENVVLTAAHLVFDDQTLSFAKHIYWFFQKEDTCAHGPAARNPPERGVTLEVTPFIKPDGLVLLRMHQTTEKVSGSVLISGVGKVPTTSKTEAQTELLVREGETIMLGGLIETDESKAGRGVPLLQDIPLLGHLFRSESSVHTPEELIVLIRTVVLPTPELAALRPKTEKEKMPPARAVEKHILEEEAARLKQADKQSRDP